MLKNIMAIIPNMPLKNVRIWWNRTINISNSLKKSNTSRKSSTGSGPTTPLKAPNGQPTGKKRSVRLSCSAESVGSVTYCWLAWQFVPEQPLCDDSQADPSFILDFCEFVMHSSFSGWKRQYHGWYVFITLLVLDCCLGCCLDNWIIVKIISNKSDIRIHDILFQQRMVGSA